jgi:uncharacterized protein YkwD
VKRILQGLLIAASLVLPATLARPHVANADGPTPIPYLLPLSSGERASAVLPSDPKPNFNIFSTPIQQASPVLNILSNNCMVTASEAALGSEENQLLSLLNAYRAQNNLPALKPFDGLNQAADWLSADSAQSGISSHTDSTGRVPDQRLRDCGFAWTAYRENIYWGQGDASYTGAQAAFTWWKNSPHHNANMLASDVTLIGVARVCNSGKCYWTLDLGNK